MSGNTSLLPQNLSLSLWLYIYIYLDSRADMNLSASSSWGWDKRKTKTFGWLARPEWEEKRMREEKMAMELSHKMRDLDL